MSITKSTSLFTIKPLISHCDETLCHNKIQIKKEDDEERNMCYVSRRERERERGWKLSDRAIQMTFHPTLSISL
jgi:hypothetical protein